MQNNRKVLALQNSSAGALPLDAGAWLEGPVRDLLRSRYAQSGSVESANASLLAAYHWTIWQKALEGDRRGVGLYHKVLFKNAEAVGVPRGLIRNLHDAILEESINLVLNRHKNSPSSARDLLKGIITANFIVLSDFFTSNQ
jgi:hypothetical protein